jgi:hypothetical protein
MNRVWLIQIIFSLQLFVACSPTSALRTTNTGNEVPRVKKKELDKYLKDAKGKHPTELMKHLPKNYYQ